MNDRDEPLFRLPGDSANDDSRISNAYPQTGSIATTRGTSRAVGRTWIVAAGVVLAVVAVIATIRAFGTSSGSNREEAGATRTVTEVRTAPLPNPPTSRSDPEVDALAQLRQIAATERSLVKAELADRWVPQVSSKRPGIVDDGVVWDNVRTLEEFRGFRERYNAKLLWSGDWSTFNAPDFWVTVVPVTFNSPGGALRWCTTQRFDSWHCLAKLVSTTHPVAGSTALN